MKYLYILFFLEFSFEVLAQEPEEYYRPPDSKQKTRVVNLPNLKGTPVRWYVGMSAAYMRNFNALDNTIDGLLVSRNYGNVAWGANAGYNLGDKWAVEVGYIRQDVQLWLEGFLVEGIPFRVIRGKKYDIFPIRYRRNIWTIDKDIRSASVYLSGGVLLNASSPNKPLNTYRVSNRVFNPSMPRDTLIGQVATSRRGTTAFELSLEIQGRVSDFLTLSAYASTHFGLSRGINSEILLTRDGRSLGSALHYTSGFSYAFGLIARYEYARGVKYRSKVE
ncbi:MAG: hypothetical protein ACK4NY_19390 [Spirosomataceae bacterium]